MAAMRLWFGLFKLRIGMVIAITALAGAAITPGPSLTAWQYAVLGLSVLAASAAAGAFNQFFERDLDSRMARTRRRPFVSGTLQPHSAWLALIALLLAAATVFAAAVLNAASASYVFLGAFVYAVVYTVWLKRRSWLNIVIGGLAGSFAVLAGAAAVTPALDPIPIILAVVLFLWTPPHFWCLAIAYHKDYAAAGVPMLPVVIGDAGAARVFFHNTVALTATSLLPLAFGMGALYAAGAVLGGALFLRRSLALVREPTPAAAMRCFHASLAQLALLLVGAMLDVGLRS